MGSLKKTLHSACYRSWQLAQLLSEPETLRRIGIASEYYQTSRLAVVKRLIKLFMAERFHPQESLANGLANPNKSFNLHTEHFSREALHGLQTAVNTPHAAMCRDKLLFHAYCAHYDLPTPKLYGVISRRGSRDNLGNPLDLDGQFQRFAEETLPSSFIAKPRGGNRGRGILLMGSEITNHDTSRLAQELKSLTQSPDDYLLEQRLDIHPDIRRLTGTNAVSTVRVVTFTPFGESPRIMAALLRIIAHDSITDNISDFETGGYSGNLLASTDVDTGIIQWTLTPNRHGVDREFIDTHPRTGEALPGFKIPLWDEAKILCTRAASLFLPLRAIGWDVAITPDGPVLIEANELFQFSAFGPFVMDLREKMQEEKKRLGAQK